MLRISTVILLFMVPPFALAENGSKARQECALTSTEFIGNLPDKFLDVPCADFGKRKDFGEMGSDVVHVMAVGAFYSKRLDHRLAAMRMLEKYECQTKEECKVFEHLLEWGTKTTVLTHRHMELHDRARAMKQKLEMKLKSF